jgi:hypothetical protein
MMSFELTMLAIYAIFVLWVAAWAIPNVIGVRRRWITSKISRETYLEYVIGTAMVMLVACSMVGIALLILHTLVV